VGRTGRHNVEHGGGCRSPRQEQGCSPEASPTSPASLHAGCRGPLTSSGTALSLPSRGSPSLPRGKEGCVGGSPADAAASKTAETSDAGARVRAKSIAVISNRSGARQAGRRSSSVMTDATAPGQRTPTNCSKISANGSGRIRTGPATPSPRWCWFGQWGDPTVHLCGARARLGEPRSRHLRSA
jgi:hypothetical protein